MRRLAIGVVLGLTGGLLTAAPPAVSAASAVEGKDAPVVARTGDLTFRVEGTSGVGSQRLTSASVKQDLDADRVSGTFVLDAAPGADSYLRVSFGHLEGNSCDAHTEFSSLVVAPTSGFTRAGRTLTLDAASAAAGYQDWDCAFAALDGDLSDSADPPPYSVLIGALTDVVATPVLSVTSVELLGSRKIKLVRGVPTLLEVEVANTGRADAESVRLTGKGKGLKVKKAGPEKVWSDGTMTYRLKVTLTGKKATKLKLKASGGGVTATRKVAVQPQRAPAPPKPGKYSSKNGRVNFSVSPARKIQGFRTFTQTTCGGYPDFPTYTMNYYDFPTVKIPRNGIVQAVDKGDLYTVRLQLLIRGGKVTKGRFNYNGPARCFAVESFTAKRK